MNFNKITINKTLVPTKFNQDKVDAFLGKVENNNIDHKLLNVLFLSDFIFDYANKKPQEFLQLLKILHELDFSNNGLQIALEKELLNVVSIDALMVKLREFRNLMFTAICAKELLREHNLQETCLAISNLADVCVHNAYLFLYAHFSKTYGTPFAENVQQHLVIFGMGKLGAFELNLSSDIDLIFTFPKNGSTQGVQRSIENKEFFTRVGQALIKAIGEITKDGFVFRVDMRLRPFGDGSPLVLSFDGIENYYYTQGSSWERYAMIKARPIAGNIEDGYHILEKLNRFIYRKYIDFSILDSLRSMKSLIISEVLSKHNKDNIKLGDGGIREVEFIAQTLQIIYGGKQPSLQTTVLKQALTEIAKLDIIDVQQANLLFNAYEFLRYTEHALQIDNKQTHNLPENINELLRISYILGFQSTQEFLQELQANRNLIAKYFNSFMQQEETAEQNNIYFFADDTLENELIKLNFSDSKAASILLLNFKNNVQKKKIQTIDFERINRFIPILVNASSKTNNPDESLKLGLQLTDVILKRSVYLVMLIEKKQLLVKILNIFLKSTWIFEQIISFPILLDDLLRFEPLKDAFEKEALTTKLQHQLSFAKDEEDQMEILRNFKLSHVLQVATSDVLGFLPIMKVSDCLTFIAEVILIEVQKIAYKFISNKFGDLPNTSEQDTKFTIVGYGKIGSLELGYSSDLDIVFLYQNSQQETLGKKVIDTTEFYLRISQRIITILSSRTLSGVLYDIDLRLRPSGESGILVNTFQAYEKYLKQDAWVWELQALVKTRLLTGTANLKESFNKMRKNLLSSACENNDLKTLIKEMRQTMRENLTKNSSQKQLSLDACDNLPFNIKHDVGGIIDIEFLVQFLVLTFAKHLTIDNLFTDNIRLLENLCAIDKITQQEASELIAIYKLYRSHLHLLALQKKAGNEDSFNFSQTRKVVVEIFKKYLD